MKFNFKLMIHQQLFDEMSWFTVRSKIFASTENDHKVNTPVPSYKCKHLFQAISVSNYKLN